MDLKTNLIENIIFNNKEIVISINESDPAIFLGLVWEARPITQWIEQFSKIVNKLELTCPEKNIVLFINSWYSNENLEQYQIFKKIRIVYIDFFLTMTYARIVLSKESTAVTNWDTKYNKFLFLTGKPNKEQRIRLLYKFYKHGLLDKANWSLFMLDSYRDSVAQLLPELTNNQLTDFITTHEKNPDSINIIQNNNTFHYGGIPFNEQLYRECSFQVVSETGAICHAWLTEKTWLAIINQRPFIIAGDTGSLTKLKRMGFKTFENYLKIQNYNDIKNNEDRLDAIVINTEHWLLTINDQQNEIANDVEYNYKRLIELAENNLKVLQSIISEYNLQCSVQELFPLFDIIQNSTWINFYSKIKDPQWPNCNQEKDFKFLPEWIQKECIEVFGYQPIQSTIAG
jgi:hypothetical protein